MVKAIFSVLVLIGLIAPAQAKEMNACEAARGLVVLGTVMQICQKFRLTPNAYLAAAVYKKPPGQRGCQGRMQAEALLQMNKLPGSTPKEKMQLWCATTFATFQLIAPGMPMIERK